MKATWRLDWPSTTTNHAYAGLGNGRLRKTNEAKTWQALVSAGVLGDRALFHSGQRLCLSVYQYPPPGWHGDNDACHKLLQDAVCKGLGINDYWIVEAHEYRGPCSDDPHIDVTLETARWRSLDEVRQ